MARSRGSNEVFRALCLFLSWFCFFLLLTPLSPATDSFSLCGEEDSHGNQDPKEAAHTLTPSPRIQSPGRTLALYGSHAHP